MTASGDALAGMKGTGMTNDERDRMIMETHDAVLTITGMVHDHHKTLYGNGQPGLKDRFLVVEKAHTECPAREAYSATAARSRRELYVAALSVLIAALALAMR
jgi:hypothetical protein